MLAVHILIHILYLLSPLSAGLVLVILGVFAWATYTGQFEDVEDEGRRILASDGNSVDGYQGNRKPADEEWPKRSLNRDSETEA